MWWWLQQQIWLSCHRLSLLLGYAYKALGKVEEVRSVSGWVSHGHRVPGHGNEPLSQNNPAWTAAPLKVTQNRRAVALESSQLLQAENSHRYQGEFCYGIMSSQTCSSRANKQDCEVIHSRALCHNPKGRGLLTPKILHAQTFLERPAASLLLLLLLLLLC